LNAQSEKIIRLFYIGKRSVKEMKKIFPGILCLKKIKIGEKYLLNFFNNGKKDSN
jgi:hypothetical protein